MDLLRAARGYGFFDVFDYGPHRGNGFLLCVGSGLLMATMDALPCLRYAIDVGGGRDVTRLADLMALANHECDPIVAHLWFSITSPDQILASLAAVDGHKLFVKTNSGSVPVARETTTFAELISAVQQREALKQGASWFE